MTFHELIARYFEEHLQFKASFPNYRRLYEQHFRSWAPAHPTRQEVRTWHRTYGETPAHANKGLSLLRAAYAWASDEGVYHGENPTARIKRHPTFARDVVLSPAQLQTILAALADAHDKFHLLALMLLCTGCRLSEALSAKWEHLDLVNGVWIKPKTKNGRPHRLPIPRPLCELLSTTAQTGPYVLMGAYGHHWSDAAAEKHWGLVREKIGMPSIRLHDFRRTVATRLFEAGESELLIKSILNHHVECSNVTAVYIRPSFERQAAALDRHAKRVLG